MDRVSGGLVVLTLLAQLSLLSNVSGDSRDAVATGAELGLPLSIAIAILRYRLFDIDVLVRRTFVYGATTAAIALTFFGGIVALQSLLRTLTSGSELAIAASTLLSFALFQPVRRGLQNAVDRRFDRSRYDAARTLDAFADRLRDEVDLDALRADLLSAVNRTMALRTRASGCGANKHERTAGHRAWSQPPRGWMCPRYGFFRAEDGGQGRGSDNKSSGSGRTWMASTGELTAARQRRRLKAHTTRGRSTTSSAAARTSHSIGL